ncbi:MAG: NnrS family protein [Campylobacterales bacterium]|nr:NnrS family protein [Campylobacterales bacterium]
MSMVERLKRSYLLSQPHQGFFLFGMLWAMVSMVLFALSYHGIVTPVAGAVELHVYTLLFLTFTQLFLGFLMTTFPRYCSTASVPGESYRPVVVLYQVGALFVLVGSVTSIWLFCAAVLLLFIAHVLGLLILEWVYHISHAPDKRDPLWMLIGMRLGALLHFSWLLGVIAQAFDIGNSVVSWLFAPLFYPYVLFVTFAVVQRMIPFFSQAQPTKNLYTLAFVFGALLFKALFASLQMALPEAIVSLALGFFVMREILWWNMRLFEGPAMVWILHVALSWLPIGLLIDALALFASALQWGEAPFLGLHLLAVGFLTTMLIGFGTRVTLGHSGRAIAADRVAVALFVWTQAVVVLRAMAALYAEQLWIFDAAVAAWMALFVLWGLRFGPMLVIKQVWRG